MIVDARSGRNSYLHLGGITITTLWGAGSEHHRLVAIYKSVVLTTQYWIDKKGWRGGVNLDNSPIPLSTGAVQQENAIILVSPATNTVRNWRKRFVAWKWHERTVVRSSQIPEEIVFIMNSVVTAFSDRTVNCCEGNVHLMEIAECLRVKWNRTDRHRVYLLFCCYCKSRQLLERSRRWIGQIKYFFCSF